MMNTLENSKKNLRNKWTENILRDIRVEKAKS